jgi:hypothetical protein
MRHHSIICRLGVSDTAPVMPARSDSHVTELHFVDGNHRLGFGLGQALDHLRELGLRPSERAVDLALLAAVLTAADTRVSRTTESQDAWTREIDLHIPVAEPAIWQDLAPLIRRMLDFLTGDRWVSHSSHCVRTQHFAISERITVVGAVRRNRDQRGGGAEKRGANTRARAMMVLL